MPVNFSFKQGINKLLCGVIQAMKDYYCDSYSFGYYIYMEGSLCFIRVGDCAKYPEPDDHNIDIDSEIGSYGQDDLMQEHILQERGDSNDRSISSGN